MNKSIIDDKRTMLDFKGVTYSGFKVTAVTKELLKAMIYSKLEESCFWGAELICSGHYGEIWESILAFYAKYVHIANPKLCIYLWGKMEKFKENMNNAESDWEQLSFRNDPAFRKMFVEIIALLSSSSKKYVVNPVKVDTNDFNLVFMKNKLSAPDLSFSEDVLKEQDSTELKITANELAYNISKGVSNTLKGYYWFEWIMDYTKLCKKTKQECKIHPRENTYIDEKYMSHPIWLVWDIIKQESRGQGQIYEKIVDSLFGLFCVRYNETCNTRRKYIVYYAISILTTNIVFTDYELVKDKKILTCILSQVDKIFLQVKEKGASKGDASSTEKIPENKIVGKSTVSSSQEKMDIITNFESDFKPRLP